MKKVIFLLLLLFSQAKKNFAQNKIITTISNIPNNRGVCQVCLFNSSVNLKKGIAFQCLQTGINNKTATSVFANVPVGEYAILVFHDANHNNKMDKNFIGLPKEGYGASLNKLPFAGPPRFEDNKFVISKTSDINLLIKLRNLF